MSAATWLFDMVGMRMFDGFRHLAWERAVGDILELGVGTGKNMIHYPPGQRVTAIDNNPRMIEKSRERLNATGTDASLITMDIQEMPFPSGMFDTVVGTCVFCTVPDPVQGLREARRICKPGGRVICLEHVRSGHPVAGACMDFLDPLVSGITGSHINRDTVGNFIKAGLKIESVRKLHSDLLVLITAGP